MASWVFYVCFTSGWLIFIFIGSSYSVSSKVKESPILWSNIYLTSQLINKVISISQIDNINSSLRIEYLRICDNQQILVI